MITWDNIKVGNIYRVKQDVFATTPWVHLLKIRITGVDSDKKLVTFERYTTGSIDPGLQHVYCDDVVGINKLFTEDMRTHIKYINKRRTTQFKIR